MQLEFSDAERDALARFLRSAIDADRYPLSPRLAPLKGDLGEARFEAQGVAASAAEAQHAKPSDGSQAALESGLNQKARRTVLSLARDLCATIPEREGRRGRRPVPYCDAVFASLLKVYATKSARRVLSDLDIAYEAGYLDRPITFSTIHTYLEKPELTPILRDLIVKSSLPLAEIETNFAIDSTGFPTSRLIMWDDIKYRGADEHHWVKAHLICGVKTNIITGIIIKNRDAADLAQLPHLLTETAKYFKVSEVLADKVYKPGAHCDHWRNRLYPFRIEAHRTERWAFGKGLITTSSIATTSSTTVVISDRISSRRSK